MESQNNEWQEPGDNQAKLKHLVVDGAGEAAQGGIGEHDCGSRQHAGIHVPAEQEIEQLAHGVHGDAR